jgi:adenylosuccinate synthase
MQDLIPRIDADALGELSLWDLGTEEVARDLEEAAGESWAVSPEVPEYRTAVFEGAQGVLLDEYRGFHPHTTWSTVTAHHAWELVRQTGADEVAVLGVTRAYATRHGEGPLPTYSRELTDRLRDPGNPPNPWQGSLRCGWLDLPLLRYAAGASGPLDGLVVNHLDQLAAAECRVCEAYANVTLSPSAAPDLAWQARLTEELRRAEPLITPTTPDGILRRLGEIAPVVLTGFGPTWKERHFTEPRFRGRREG